MREHDPIITLIESYHELNPSVVEELHTEPTSLEFLRRVTQNEPFIIR
jgi:jumonji domain-containing protein 7